MGVRVSAFDSTWETATILAFEPSHDLVQHFFSAMAVQAAQEVGLKGARHLQGGVQAWKLADGPLTRP